jgi:hypothetical protein
MLGLRKRTCPKCWNTRMVRDDDQPFTCHQLDILEMLRRSPDPVALLRATVAAWDAQCDDMLARVKAELPDTDIEPMRRDLRSRFTEYRLPASPAKEK